MPTHARTHALPPWSPWQEHQRDATRLERWSSIPLLTSTVPTSRLPQDHFQVQVQPQDTFHLSPFRTHHYRPFEAHRSINLRTSPSSLKVAPMSVPNAPRAPLHRSRKIFQTTPTSLRTNGDDSHLTGRKIQYDGDGWGVSVRRRNARWRVEKDIYRRRLQSKLYANHTERLSRSQ